LERPSSERSQAGALLFNVCPLSRRDVYPDCVLRFCRCA
jgi:hypothetical protein